jgi:hypothetical protein
MPTTVTCVQIFDYVRVTGCLQEELNTIMVDELIWIVIDAYK